MTVNGAYHTFTIVDGAIIFEAFLFRHLTHIVGAGLIGGSGNTGGFTETIFLARREKYNR